MKDDPADTTLFLNDLDFWLASPLKAHCDASKRMLQYEGMNWKIGRNEPKTFFELVDTNNDDKITPVEFFKPFYDADNVKDYVITPDEIQEYLHQNYKTICKSFRPKPKNRHPIGRPVKTTKKTPTFKFPAKGTRGPHWSTSKLLKQHGGN